MFLNPEELQTLTGKRRRPAQRKALSFMGVEHKVRPDGALIVSRSHIEKLLDGAPQAKTDKRIEPNWNALGHDAHPQA